MNENRQNKSVLYIIKQKYDSMTTAEQKIALYMMANPEKVIYLPVISIAKAVCVSEASIVRFCKSIGFQGLKELKVEMAKDIGSEDASIEKIKKKRYSSPKEIVESTFMNHIESFQYNLRSIDWGQWVKAVNMLMKAEKIAFFAIGNSFSVSYYAFWLFSAAGKLSLIQQDPGAQILLANTLSEKDVAFTISTSGQSHTSVKCQEIAKTKKASTICISQNNRSELANNSDCILILRPNIGELSWEASIKVVQMASIDALCLAMLSDNNTKALDSFKESTRLTRSRQY